MSLLALLGAFQQWLKGPVGLSISIPVCPASPLPGWEVLYFQKLEHGAEMEKFARVGVRSGKYHFSSHLNKQIFVRVTPVCHVVVGLLNQKAGPPEGRRGHLKSLALPLVSVIKLCTQNCALRETSAFQSADLDLNSPKVRNRRERLIWSLGLKM